MEPLVSVIIPVKNEGSHIVNTVRSILGVCSSSPYEIIVVDDGSEDGCCEMLRNMDPEMIRIISTPALGSARARNAGAAVAGGGILIFCDAHIFVEDDWIDRLVEPIAGGILDAACPGIAPHDRPHDVAGGFTWNEELRFKWLPKPPGLAPVPLLPGGCLAVKKEVFHAVEGFDRGFLVWGREDEEISLKMWLFGYCLGVNPQVKILHVFRERHPYRVTWDHVDHNLLRMAYSHMNDKRIAGTINLIRHHQNHRQVIRIVNESDAPDQRKKYFARRKRTDDWFFERFRIPF